MALSFGTSGVRGLVTEFTDQQVYLLVSAFLKYADTLKISKSVSTGRDLRDSSPKMLEAVHHAIADHSKTILSCGDVPTPSLAFYSQEKTSLAVMVTGSHIPADRNGVKFYLESGETLKHDDLAIFNQYLKLKEENYKTELFDSIGNFKAKTTPTTIDVTVECQELFIKRYVDFFKDINLSSYKVLFYEHSSVARDLAPAILEKLGATVKRLGRSDVFIPVDTEAVDSLAQFQKWMDEHKADALVSTDGDGDRPLVVDNQGQIIQGDKLGMITSLYLSIQAVALPISCNSGVSELKQLKQTVFTKIGSPFVVAALDELAKKYDQVAGFEANGGYILKSNISKKDSVLKSLPTRDSVLPIVALLALAAKEKMTPSELINQLPQKYTASVLVKNCPLEVSARILEKVQDNNKTVIQEILGGAALVAGVNMLDGVRITTTDDEVVHFRPSGNAPEFRCYLESSTQKKVDQMASAAKEFIVRLIETR
tara:strand:+ start:38611 stop:40059 length:1449 start_codon:yes stop_codon:yes gene_type:complete